MSQAIFNDAELLTAYQGYRERGYLPVDAIISGTLDPDSKDTVVARLTEKETRHRLTLEERGQLKRLRAEHADIEF